MGSAARSIISQSYQTFTAEINCNYFQLGALRGRILAPESLFEMLNQNGNGLAVSNFHFVKLYLKYISIDLDVAFETRVNVILMRAEA